MKNNINYSIEYTDTFGNEANFSWVKRYRISVPHSLSDKTVNAIAKELCGLTGIRGKWENIGENRSFKPIGFCTILFITSEY